MGEAVMKQRHAEAEAVPKRRALGRNERELREMLRAEQETERLAITHRVRLHRRVDATKQMVTDGMLLFQRAVAARMAEDERPLAEHFVHALLMHCLIEGMTHALGPLLHLLGGAKALFAIVSDAVIAEHHAGLHGGERAAMLSLGDAVLTSMNRTTDRAVAALHAWVETLPEESLADDERLLLAHHGVYASSERYSEPMLDLVDAEFIEAAHGLPADTKAGSVALAMGMAQAFEMKLARLHHPGTSTSDTVEVHQAVLAHRTSSAVLESMEALGTTAALRDERSRIGELGEARP